MPDQRDRRRKGAALDLVASTPPPAASSIASAATSALSVVAASPPPSSSSSPSSSNHKNGGPLSFLLSRVTALPLGALIREAWRRRRKTVELSGGAAKAIAARGEAKSGCLIVPSPSSFSASYSRLRRAFSSNFDVCGSKTICAMLYGQQKRPKTANKPVNCDMLFDSSPGATRQQWRSRLSHSTSSSVLSLSLSTASTAARALAAATGITLVSWVLPATWACVDLLALVALVPLGGKGGGGGQGKQLGALSLSRPPFLGAALTLASKAGKALAPAALARTLGGAALAAAAPDTARTLTMWGSFLPIYLRYRWTKHRFSCEPRGAAGGRLPWCGGQPWPEVESAWDRRHEWGAPRVHGMLSSLSGYYVKAAQVRVLRERERREKERRTKKNAPLFLQTFSTTKKQVLAIRGDFVPKQWVPLLSRMFDSMDPRSWSDVKKDIEAGLDASPVGRAARARAEAEAEEASNDDDDDREETSTRRCRRPLLLLVRVIPFSRPVRRLLRRRKAKRARIHLDEVFLRVNDRPLATASIAQVHCAQLDSSFRASLGWRWPASAGLGPSVVLKVQNQAMRGLMDSDVRNLGRLAAFVGDMMPFDVGGVRSFFSAVFSVLLSRFWFFLFSLFFFFLSFFRNPWRRARRQASIQARK